MRLYWGAGLSPLEWIECALVAASLAAALLRPGFGQAWFARREPALARLASRPWLSAALVAALAVVPRLLLLPVDPVPVASIHDEFSMLLEADTLLHGRLANPALPLWQHFETLFVISQPTYSSQYLPGQPAALALGWAVFGHPWAGVVLGVALLCALSVWMLRAWVPPPWALLGGAVLALHLGVLSYWMDTYWGGAVPAVGGLLALGAAPRALGRKWTGPSLVAGAGLGIVFLCRPLEAALLVLFLAGWMAVRAKRDEQMTVGRIVLRAAPAAMALAAAVAFQAYDNSRVTGSPLTFAYQINQREYGTPQSFLFQKPVQVENFRHQELRDEYLEQLRLYRRGRTPAGFAAKTAGMLRSMWGLYFGPLLTVPLIFCWGARRGTQVREAAALVGVFFVAHALYHAYYPHYDAPALGAFLLLIVAGWMRMSRWQWRGRPSGAALSRLLAASCAASPLLLCAVRIAGPGLPGWQNWGRKVEAEFAQDNPRHAVMRCLEAQPGRQLAIIRYRQPGHDPGGEWVYNGADPAAEKVITARDMGEAANGELETTMADRKVWLVEPDERPPRLTPLSGQLSPTPGSCPGVR